MPSKNTELKRSINHASYKKNIAYFISTLFYIFSSLCCCLLLSSCGKSQHNAPPPPADKANISINLATAPAEISMPSEHQPTIMLDGEVIALHAWGKQIQESIATASAHEIKANLIAFSDKGNTIRCTAKPITIAAKSLAANSSTSITINYSCNSRKSGGDFVNCTTQQASQRNTLYSHEAAAADEKPLYNNAGLLVHILDKQVDFELDTNNNICGGNQVCDSFFNLTADANTRNTASQQNKKWPGIAWAFSYIQSDLKAKALDLPTQVLFNSTNILQNRNSPVLGAAINGQLIDAADANKNSWVQNNMMCAYPLNADSDYRQIKNGAQCPCGMPQASESSANSCGRITSMPTAISSPDKYYKYFLAQCYGKQQGTAACDFPSLPGNEQGFDYMLKISQYFSKLDACSATTAEGSQCNITCPPNNAQACLSFNEVDIASADWKNYLSYGKNYDANGKGAAIYAVFALCSDHSATQPCQGSTLHNAMNYAKSLWGMQTSYPILQDKIPMLLLNIDSLSTTQSKDSHSIATENDNTASAGPFICPQS